jgi:FAD/FMN-containing dehydrogenase
LRDTLLQIRSVSADGLLVTGGGPTVKNVTGFDLPRLFVGSLGIFGLLGEALFRTRPLVQVERWLAGPADPFALRRALHRPTSLLWDGTTTWALLTGYDVDVDAQSAIAARFGLLDCAGPPVLPPCRQSLPPGALAELDPAVDGPFVAEVGVGIVHRSRPLPPPPLSAPVIDLHRRLKDVFDPRHRLNPGRSPLDVV